MEELDINLRNKLISGLAELGFKVIKKTKKYLYFTKNTGELTYMVENRYYNDRLLISMGINFNILDNPGIYHISLDLSYLQDKRFLDNTKRKSDLEVGDEDYYYDLVIKGVNLLMSEFNNMESIINIYESKKYPSYVMGNSVGFLNFGILYLIYKNDIERAKKEFQKFIDFYRQYPLSYIEVARIKFIELTIEEIKKGIDKDKIVSLIKQMNTEVNKD